MKTIMRNHSQVMSECNTNENQQELGVQCTLYQVSVLDG